MIRRGLVVGGNPKTHDEGKHSSWLPANRIATRGREQELKEHLMLRGILGILILTLVPCLGQAQSSGYSKWYGYGYFAPGGRVTSGDGSRVTIQIGVGGERFFSRHLGAGADVGFAGRMAPEEKFFSGWGTFSSNFLARFPAKDNKKKAEPFVTAGYTRVMPVGHDDQNGINFGVGVNWWLQERVALRIEMRDHIPQPFSQGALVHFVGLRIGLTFR
jgi:hypothetical protein